MFSRPVWAEIDLSALKNNVVQIRNKLANNTKIMAVVKGNAYGHGTVAIAKALQKEGITYFSVAILEEAIELREAGIEDEILILGWTPPEDFEKALDYGLTFCIYDEEEAYMLDALAKKKGVKAKIHIKLDTGMTRIGFLPGPENEARIADIFSLSNIYVEGIFTHLSKADEKNKEYALQQIDHFKRYVDTIEALTGCSIPLKHAANSASILSLPEAHFDIVRAGIILYGLKPSDEVGLERSGLRPVLSLKARLSRVKNIPPETLVSYGGFFKTDHLTKIGTIPIGYADGYTRLLSDKGQVVVRNKKRRIIGKICMDQCMVTLDGIENIDKGEEIFLIGGYDVCETADDVAEKIGTINYEIVSMISKRVPRIYKE